jgi:hypothetical protein
MYEKYLVYSQEAEQKGKIIILSIGGFWDIGIMVAGPLCFLQPSSQ